MATPFLLSSMDIKMNPLMDIYSKLHTYQKKKNIFIVSYILDDGFIVI